MFKEFKIAIKIQKETGRELSFFGLNLIIENFKNNYSEECNIESVKSYSQSFVSKK